MNPHEHDEMVLLRGTIETLTFELAHAYRAVIERHFESEEAQRLPLSARYLAYHVVLKEGERLGQDILEMAPDETVARGRLDERIQAHRKDLGLGGGAAVWLH